MQKNHEYANSQSQMFLKAFNDVAYIWKNIFKKIVKGWRS